MTARIPRKDFLAELARRGYPRSARWHEDWIELGLLDRGDRTPGIAHYTWPSTQIELATALLEKSTSVSRGALPKLVVFVWLWWGDDWVPFRQIPRAMQTWAKAEAAAPSRNVRATARALVSRIAHKRATGKLTLVRALADFPAQGDPESLRDAIDEVVDPEYRGAPRGPLGAQLTTDSYLELIKARQRTIGRLGHLTYDEFAAARMLYRKSRVDYESEQPHYARDPDLGRMHPPVDVNELADSACADLLDCLAVLGTKAKSR